MQQEVNQEVKQEVNRAVNQEGQAPTPEIEIDQTRYEQFLYQMEGNQNFPMGIIGGIIAASIGAGAWAAITVLTNYQIGWMAVGVGCLVGYAVRVLGKGLSKIYGYVGAALALIGCLGGNFLSVCGMISKQEAMPFFDLISRLNPLIIMDLMRATFNPIDLLFYGIAVYEGYRFSFRQITEEELSGLVKAKT